MPTDFRVLITGSRDWEDWELINQDLTNLLDVFDEALVVIHGGARGADTFAEETCVRWGIKYERHVAKWNELGKRAGYVRNAEMVAAGANLCLAYIKNNSRGATMCAELAEKAGIYVVRHEA